MNTQTAIVEGTPPIYAMDRFVYFDIETIPSQDPAHLETLKRQVTAPSSYKKKESIEKWLDENRESAALEAMEKTSFDGGRGHVCTIGWAKNDGEIHVSHARTVSEERQVIGDFFDALDDYHSEKLVGHNIAVFDIPFLRKRALVLGVDLPPPASFPRDPKPWDRNVHDTMSMWAGGTNRVSMDNLCAYFGISGKGGFDGSQVAAAWAAGEHDKIAQYCRDDVWRTREVHKRFLRAGW